MESTIGENEINIIANNYNLYIKEEMLTSCRDGTKYLSYSINGEDYRLKQVTSALIIKNNNPKTSNYTNFYMPIINSSFKEDTTISNFKDSIGTGKKIKITCRFSQHQNKKIFFDGTINFKIYEVFLYIEKSNFESSPQKLPYITIRLKLLKKRYNDERDSAEIYGYAPLYQMDHGELDLSFQNKTPHISPKTFTFYSNGHQSWSLNRLLTFKDKWRKRKINLIRRNMENQDELLEKIRYRSELHTIISNTQEKKSMILSFITTQNQFSRIDMERLLPASGIQYLCAYSQTDRIQFRNLNNELFSSEELMISFSHSDLAYEILRMHSLFNGIKSNFISKRNRDILSGWCSWYYYYTTITEKNMLENLEYFKDRKDIPIDLIQLDDGFQTEIADWGIDKPYTFNDKFPNGLKWLVSQIHDAGFKAGLWTAPFFITKNSNLYNSHSDWTLTDIKKDIEIKTTYNWAAFQYGMDLSRKDVYNHLVKLAKVVGQEWGFDFIKIDFLFASAPLNAWYKKPYDETETQYSRAQIIHRGIQAIREGMGEDKFILGCGCPLGPAVGLVDVMRIGPDTAAKWSFHDWLLRRFANIAVNALKPALLSTISRSYMHNTLWINDPDCVVVRKNKSKLTLDSVLLQLTVFGLSGGQVFISDDETLVEADRINLMNKIIPPFNPNENEILKYEKEDIDPFNTVPLDILINKYPTLYAKTILTPIGKRHLVSIINWKRKAVKRTLEIKSLLNYSNYLNYQDNPSQTFLIFDFWNEKSLGIYSLDSSITIDSIPPRGCIYLNLIPLPNSWDFENKPLFLTSTLHLLQGAEEVKSITYISDKKVQMELTLKGTHTGNVYFLVNDNKIETIPIEVTENKIMEHEFN